MSVRVNARISERANQWLDKKSEEMAVSKSALISISIENYIKETEVVNGLPEILRRLDEQGMSIPDASERINEK